MKKKLLFLPIALLGLVLAGCNASELQDNFTEADQVVETPWEDYVLPASGIEFADGEDSITLKKGETHTYSYQIQPRGATSNSLNWASNDVNVATVDKGVVTAVGGGDATITASSPDSAFDPVELEVNVVVPLTNFTLTIPERLDWSEQYTFDVSYEPSDTTERDLVYEISEASAEGLVSVNEQGVITTTNQNGTATLKVTGANNVVKTYTLNISTIAVTGVVLADAGHELEVNHSLQLAATVSPSDATELGRRGVRYYSRQTDIATVDELTGVVLGVAPGTAQIYAECGGVESANYEIEVYKVTATSVDITTADFTLSNNNDNGLSKQLEYQITVDRAGHTEPSAATISFEAINEAVATVSDSGLVTAVGPGATKVYIRIAQEGLDVVEDFVTVTVDIVSKTLTINGGNSFYNDSTLTLTASLTPGNVTNNEITWEVTPTDVVNLSNTTGGSVTLTPVDNDVTGVVTVTATNTGGASNSIQVTVADRPAEFTVGHHYIVGNRAYNTGESNPAKTSWAAAKYAYHFTYSAPDPSCYEQFKGTIKFAAGDQFRYFIGADYWVPVWEQQEDWAEKGYHIQIDGASNAFALGQMRFVKENEATHEFEPSDAADANIEVVEAGYYDLYAKLYKNADDSLWYALYIQKVPNLSVEIDEITMGTDESFQIKAHDWIGQVSYSIKDGSDDCITLSPTGLVTGKGLEGDAIVVVNDDRGVAVEVTFHLQTGAHAGKTVYLNANGLFDAGNVVPFVHSWGGEGSSAAADVMMNKVDGQTIIYSASIPLDHSKIDFVRCAEGSTLIVWDEIYNQSKDQDIPTGDNPMFTMTGYSSDLDSRNNAYVNGSWSTFDSSETYQVEEIVNPPYVMYKAAGEWAFKPLVANPGNSGELMADVDLEANAEFVIRVSENDWRHWNNRKNDIASQVVQGTVDDQNYKATVAGTYHVYVVLDSTYDGGKTVYVGFDGGDPVVPPEPNVITIYFCDALVWDDGTSEKTMSAYVWKNGVNNSQKVAWPGESATYVGLDTNDDKVYSYDVDINSYDRIIFVAGTNQTDNIDISAAANHDGFKATTLKTDSTYNFEAYTYVPKAVASTYTVSFNHGAGTGDMDPVEGISGSYTLPPAPNFNAPVGQVFVGWKVNNEGETKAVGATIIVSADVTLYAQYAEPYTPTNVTLYFTNNHLWQSVYAYAWDSSDDSIKNADWPGVDITGNRVGMNAQYQDVYSLTIDIGMYDSLVFTNGESADDEQKTVDIDISSAVTNNAYYLGALSEGKYAAGTWTYNESELIDETGIKVIYFVNNKAWELESLKKYMWNAADDSIKNADWPGEAIVNTDHIGENKYGQWVFKIVINTTVKDVDMLIINQGAKQTENITLSTFTGNDNGFWLNDDENHISTGHVTLV